METLGSRIKQLRLRAKLNKAALAREIGVSDVTVSYWESGAIKQIGHERLVALADALGCSLATLLEGDNAPTLPTLNHTGPLPWEQRQAKPVDPASSHLPLNMSWQQPAYIATPGANTHFAPLKTGDLVLLGPTDTFKQAGYYIVIQNQQTEIEHLTQAPGSNVTLKAAVLAHWRPL
ncbi:helix-turn-helix domain-containing protein [Vreelandella massiliensis]|uniref:helix-turn-helix domain-containing protein n=1 Tax=Vreelandella massiliensis TaxID=1816686 RepID=UPI00096A86A2|nr:helix-turn-helix domain-containing protein [Halomonas massiliensis]MYL22555.1 helix-turn-helix domain-containing protein [Halomonas alkaliantarctica]